MCHQPEPAAHPLRKPGMYNKEGKRKTFFLIDQINLFGQQAEC